ncbi:phosphate transport system permease protein PstC [Oxobacter pfennigii]|uniref:Phosphate transport system permease protein PstC n=1 Tax=Oxobacter pfennigii TaxID=36849 RepID=A0A0P8YAK4_9CLOT|nr:phosphate ABC transporter permease subunit PstC [Oxobacter pfennigii]KPU44020.1 phosphate transport system permease protein PstC [Oxobacter pfennigii]
MKREIREKFYRILLLSSAFVALLVIILIAGFVFREGLPIFSKYGLFNVLFGTEWHPQDKVYGLLPMIVGTICVTIGALVVGVPLGLLTAIFLAELAPKKLVTMLIRPAIELLAGIPSVVYGLFGMTTIVPFIRNTARSIPSIAEQPALSSGYGIIAGSIILSIMILPTVINVSEDALRSVPLEYKEGSFALGATHWQTIYKVIVPAAKSGILAAIVLGMGRAMGETMAIIMVAGNAAIIPESILSTIRSLTGNIAIEMAYSSGEHTQALFATGIVLFIFTMLINSFAMFLAKKEVKS